MAPDTQLTRFRLGQRPNPEAVLSRVSVPSGPGFKLTLHRSSLDVPRRWSAPRLVFVDSMSDLFHDDVPPEFIAQVFEVIRQTPQHTCQVLTKRAQRLSRIAGELEKHGSVAQKQHYGARRGRLALRTGGTAEAEAPLGA